jgi:hypothetical protein
MPASYVQVRGRVAQPILIDLFGSGVYFVKSNAKTIKVFQEVEDLFIANPDVVALRDQAAFTEVFCAGSIGTDEAVSVSGAKMALLSKAEVRVTSPSGLCCLTMSKVAQRSQYPLAEGSIPFFSYS